MDLFKRISSLVTRSAINPIFDKPTEPKEEGETVGEMHLALFDAIFEHYEACPVVSSSLMKEVVDNLAIFRAILMDPPEKIVEDGTLKEVESLVIKAASVISKFDIKKMDQHMAHELHKELVSTLTPMWIDEAGIFSRTWLEELWMYFPRTGQLWFLDHLVENLEELVKAKGDSVGPLKLFILHLKRKLQFLSCSFKEIPEARKEEADVKNLMESITNMAHEVEFVIDLFLVRDIAICYCLVWLRETLKEIEHKERLVKMDFDDTQSIVSSIVDLKSSKLNTIPFVSKTEISAKLYEVFNHTAMQGKYNIRTWSLVSSYKERRKEVFLELLRNASCGLHDDSNGSFSKNQKKLEMLRRRLKDTKYMNEDKLGNLVYELLKDKKYFIILEDMQDIDALNDIKRVLPENYNKSRILLTTRSPEVAVHCHYDSQESFRSRDCTSTSQTNKLIIDDDVVGFKAETTRMLELLIRGPTQLRIISIVGMAGQGKTTLAKLLYSDLPVINHFHIHAWCCVSQAYEIKELLLELLSQIVQLSETIHHKNDIELAELLCKSLRGRRFFIVLDDMWSIQAWNDIRRAFPNDQNGSRIIFTTRLQQLASQAQSGALLQPLDLLSDDESWELLSKKLFQKESCPPELLGVGTQIAKNCKGLPLAVILIAGLLGKMEKQEDQWKQIAEGTLSSCLLGDAKAQTKGIIELSYKNLPDYLKPCFLYFGAFLEDRYVLVWKLIRLWIAEGFIKYSRLKSLEDIAEEYLMDLIGRSLVTIAQKKSNGGVKSCRVHDLLHEFCLTKAREENFLQWIHGYNKHFPSSYDHLDYSVDPHYSYSSTPIKYQQRRLCIYSERNHFIMLKPHGLLVRSLLFTAASDMCPSYSYDIAFISQNFKLLKILDLEDINIGDSFKVIDVLVRLRYLAVQTSVDFIPSSIANLWNLETFIVKGLRDTIVKVPDSIWDMSKLRHVHINDNASFDLHSDRLEKSCILDNLQTFSTPSLTYGDDMEKMMRRLRGIRKLKCIFLDSWDDAGNCNRLPMLGVLSQLISLKVFYNGMEKYPCEFDLPSNLKKLTLSNFRMPWNEISQLAKLCNLEVLKLLCKAFEGEIWEMEDEVFEKLKFLKLDTLDVVEWRATSDHFPRLECLLLHKCERLEEIPSGIGDVPTLQMIEVMWCSPSVAISAKAIEEEQLEYGNDELKIHIYPKVSDLGYSS